MKMKSTDRILLGIVILVVLLFTYSYPRALISSLGIDNPWTSYLYQYTFGLLFFSLGIFMILKTKACIPGRGRDSLWLKVLVGGFIFFASLHAIWVALALYIPFKGVQ